MPKALKLLIDSVERIRVKRGMTKSELARRAGMSPQQLGDQLDEGRDSRISLADRLAEALEVPVADLLRGPAETLAPLAPEPGLSALMQRLDRLESRLESKSNTIPPDILRDLETLAQAGMQTELDTVRALLKTVVAKLKSKREDVG